MPPKKLTDDHLKDAKRRLEAEPGLSQRKLAAELGVDQAALSRGLARISLVENSLAQDETTIAIPHARLRPDPNNPRRTFSDDSIAELAATIESQGLLQNLLVKPASEGGIHEITSGERRWRAIGLLISENRWQGEIPCKVQGGDAAQQLARAIVENLQREDVSPLEEADAFARLQEMDPERYAPAIIAVMIGKTPRFVQQRIALARKLHPAAKRLLEHNLLTVEACRLLAGCDEAIQAEVIAGQFDLENANDLLAETGPTDDELANWAPVSTDDIEGEIRWCRNRKENIDRMRETAARAAEDEAASDDDDTQPELLETAPSQRAATPHQPARGEAQNVLDDPAALPLPEPAGPVVTKNHIYHAHRRKSLALRFAVMLDSTNTMRLTCLALLTRNSSVMLQPRQFFSDAVRDDDPGELLGMEAAVQNAVGKFDQFSLSDKQLVKLWQKLEALSGDDLHRLFAALVARHIVTPAGFDCTWGDTPLSLAIAKTLGIAGDEAAHGLTITREDLAGIRKPALLAIADEINAPGVNDSTKTADLIEAIASTNTDYVLPTLRFTSTEQTEKALKELTK